MFRTDDFGAPVAASVAELAATLDRHMAVQEVALPTPAMVALYPTRRMIGMAPYEPDLVVGLSGALLWTYSLDAPRTTWCHQENGTVVIRTCGYTANGTELTTATGPPAQTRPGTVHPFPARRPERGAPGGVA